MRILIIILVCFGISGCAEKAFEVSWINMTDTLRFPLKPLTVQVSQEPCSAVLLTATQPILCDVKCDKGKCSVTTQFSGITEGPANLCIISGNHVRYFPVYAVNESKHLAEFKEYNSPKTVNPDSGVLIHTITTRFDSFRNVLPANNQSLYFPENKRSVTHQSGTYYGESKAAIYAYYVQPGSVTDLPLKVVSGPEEKYFRVKLGPLVDANNNQLANGTLIRFIVKKKKGNFISEQVALNGFANLEFPKTGEQKIEIMAIVNDTQSGILKSETQ
jgi:hypothetical protein